MQENLGKSASKKKILLLRGGSYNHAGSITLGAEFMQAFPRYDCEVIDVYVDEAGVWHRHGVPTDAHRELGYVDAYLDLTGNVDGAYHVLAKKLGVERLIKYMTDVPDDRESVYRLLRQHGVLVPETKLFRSGSNVHEEDIHTLWRSMIMPLIVRDIYGEYPSVTVKTPGELTAYLKEMLPKTDLHVFTYRNKKPRSVLVLPEYRGEPLYVPVPVETQVKQYELPRKDNRIMPLTYLKEEDKRKLMNFARDIYQKLPLTDQLLLIDLIDTPKGFMVVDATTTPNMGAGSRLRESLATTGVDMAHYFATRLK